MKPLQNTTILDLTHMLSGPYCTMLLADLGARVVKVEPLNGENTRRLLSDDPVHSIQGMGAYFLTLNRNKESVCIDLKSQEGLDLFYEFVTHSDVVVSNFSPNVVERLKIDHATLSKINPRIITCSITGFGETGPACDRPAFDQVAQGMGGGMSITGFPGGEPLRAGIPIGDLGGGTFGVIGILAALQARATTGCGQHVDISMLDVQISLLNYMATMYFLSGVSPGPEGNRHFVHVPYGTYRTLDHWIIVAVIGDSAWQGLVDALSVPELEDPAFLTQPGRARNRQFLDETLQRVLATNTCAHWMDVLNRHRVPCAPVNDFEKALNDPQVRARNMVVYVPHPEGGGTEMPGNPVKLSGFREETYGPPPLLGQHTDDVLREVLGKSESEISALRELGAIG